MRTWQCFLDLQTKLAYGDHAGVIGAPQVIEKLFNQASSCSRPNSCRS